MKNIYIVFVAAMILISGCSSEKTLMSNNTVYSYEVGGGGGPITPTYHKFKVNNATKVKISDNGKYLILQTDPTKDTKTYPEIGNSTLNKQSPSWKAENIGYAYFPEAEDKTGPENLWYRDWKFVLQTATVPLKIRPAITKNNLQDSIPSQAETGFSIGFVAGAKHTWNKYRKTQNAFGQYTDRFSITPGFFLSTGAVDLKKTNTRPAVTFERKAATISTGGVFVIGFNSINIGYALGVDFATGVTSSTWVYQGKLWHGVIVSLDLIK